MVYFSDGSTKYKLILLLFLESLNIEITREQLTTVVASYDIMPYFDLQNSIYELEEDGFLAAVPRPFGTAYCITPKGHEAISAFSESIPLSERETIYDSADMCRAQLRNETQYTHRIEKLPTGAFNVILRVIEAQGEVFSVAISFPDSRSANTACEKWSGQAPEIYSLLLSFLS